MALQNISERFDSMSHYHKSLFFAPNVNLLARQPVDNNHIRAALLPAQSLVLHQSLQCDVHDNFLLEVM
jgi:hypothetical protein